MYFSHKNFIEWELFPLYKDFLSQIRNLPQNQPSDNEEKKEFLNNLKIPLYLTDIPTIEELSQFISDINKKTNEETQIIIRKKWRENEKKFLIWVIFYYLKIQRKKFQEMVFI